jgi:hypothetical protein
MSAAASAYYTGGLCSPCKRRGVQAAYFTADVAVTAVGYCVVGGVVWPPHATRGEFFFFLHTRETSLAAGWLAHTRKRANESTTRIYISMCLPVCVYVWCRSLQGQPLSRRRSSSTRELRWEGRVSLLRICWAKRPKNLDSHPLAGPSHHTQLLPGRQSQRLAAPSNQRQRAVN